MRAFKGLVHRWVSVAAQVAPFIAEEVLPILRESAAAAAKHCTHGTSGRDCAFSWVDGEASGGEVLTGAGEQMSALAAVSSLLITEAGAPVLNSTADGKRDGGPGGGGAPGGGSGNDPNSAARSGVVVLPLLVCLGVYGWMNL
jgi:mannan endo-1,6-alpha-mannosidase